MPEVIYRDQIKKYWLNVKDLCKTPLFIGKFHIIRFFNTDQINFFFIFGLLDHNPHFLDEDITENHLFYCTNSVPACSIDCAESLCE